jgi:hypothetical protein
MHQNLSAENASSRFLKFTTYVGSNKFNILKDLPQVRERQLLTDILYPIQRPFVPVLIASQALNVSRPGLPDLSWDMIPKLHQMNKKRTKCS